jgi:CheY-like chemotaxis protein
MDSTPRALIVEDSEVHRFLAETLLGEVGFQTTCVSSLLHGLDIALAWLAPANPPVPTLILLDLMLPHERCPIMEGTALVAHLTEAMEAQQVQQAHLVAITSEPTELRCAEAMLAGVTRVLGKLLTTEAAVELRQLVAQRPVSGTEGDQHLPPAQATERRLARQVQRRDATRLLHFLRSDAAYSSLPLSQQNLHWTRESVRLLLLEPTRLVGEEPWLSWARSYGGLDVVQARLRQVNLSHDLRPVLESVLANGSDWRSSLSQLNVAKTTYYRRLDTLCDQLAVALTTWG